MAPPKAGNYCVAGFLAAAHIPVCDGGQCFVHCNCCTRGIWHCQFVVVVMVVVVVVAVVEAVVVAVVALVAHGYSGNADVIIVRT